MIRKILFTMHWLSLNTRPAAQANSWGSPSKQTTYFDELCGCGKKSVLFSAHFTVHFASRVSGCGSWKMVSNWNKFDFLDFKMIHRILFTSHLSVMNTRPAGHSVSKRYPYEQINSFDELSGCGRKPVSSSPHSPGKRSSGIAIVVAMTTANTNVDITAMAGWTRKRN